MFTTKRVEKLVAAFAIGLLLLQPIPDQPPAESRKDQPPTKPEWSELLRRSVAGYRIRRDVADKAPLSLQMKPVLRWANNTRMTEDGFTYLWIAKGRPEAVSCIYSWGPSAVRHNFGSLSRGPLVAERDGKPVWRPDKPGVDFLPLPGAPAPSGSAPERLRQMKDLAGRFRAVLGPGYWNRSEEQLRLLPRELYRYQSEDPDLVDGALFAFCQGTDPEVLLLLEAAQTKAGMQWQYGLARRTDGSLIVRYRDNIVWTAPEARGLANGPADPYLEFEIPFGQ